jgi:membrane-associated phospholipid phosphatase
MMETGRADRVMRNSLDSFGATRSGCSPSSRRILSLVAIHLVILLSPPWAGAQELGANLRGDAGYLGYTVWEDAKTIARAPLEIGRIADITPEQLLIAALAVGSVGGMIALDGTIRERAKGIDDGSALALQYAGFSLVSGGLVALYGAGLWTDNEPMRHAALSGLESTVVAWGIAGLMKVGFGRERPDANKGPYAWFQGGRSFVSADTTPAFALAEAVAAGFDHRWEVALPAYVAAAAVGVGRMGRDRHWASDVLASAFLGVGTTKLFNYMHRRREEAAVQISVSPQLAPRELGLRLDVRY